MRARCLEETWPTTPVPPRPPRRGPPWPAAPFSGHHRHYASHEHHPHRNNSHDLYFLFRVHFPPTNITITPALQTVKEKYRPRSFHCSAQVFIIIIVMIIIIIFIIIIIIIGWRWDEVMYQKGYDDREYIDVHLVPGLPCSILFLAVWKRDQNSKGKKAATLM